MTVKTIIKEKLNITKEDGKVKKIVAVVGLMIMSGCASQSAVNGLTQQVIVSSDLQQQFAKSTVDAQRNTVARVAQLESMVKALQDRVCWLESRNGKTTDQEKLDKQFKKYMSK